LNRSITIQKLPKVGFTRGYSALAASAIGDSGKINLWDGA